MTIATITLADRDSDLAAGARSSLYRLLADAFSYPSGSFVENLRSGEWSRLTAASAEHLPFELAAVSPPSDAVAAEPLQQAYVNLFEVGVGRPFCPLYEGSHRSGRMKLMEDLARFYEHFGLKAGPGDHPDHLCAELEFMHYMTFKEAAALAHGDTAEDLHRAQRDFLARHLCKWLPRLRARLQSADDAPAFYRFASGLCQEFCARDLAWLREQ